LGDTQAPSVLIEHRDSSLQEPSFSLFDLATQKPLRLQLRFGAGHWLSAWALQGQRGVFVLYAGKDNPLQQAFWVYDFAQDCILWEESRYTLRRLVGDCIEVSPRQGAIEQVLYLHLQDGKRQKTAPAPSQQAQLHWPQLYERSDTYFEEVNQFLALYQIQAEQAPIGYWELADKALVSYLREHEGFLAHFLAVFHANGQGLEHYLLQKSKPEAFSPIFFIFKKHLFFVKNKIELVSFPLKSL
jgi:hypothetical protein